MNSSWSKVNLESIVIAIQAGISGFLDTLTMKRSASVTWHTLVIVSCQTSYLITICD